MRMDARHILAVAFLSAAMLSASLVRPACAGIILLETPPADVSPNVLEADDDIYLFAEKVLVITESHSITVDVLGPTPGGTWNSSSSSDATIPGGVIPAGTTVRSWMLHYDRVADGSDPGNAGNATGTWTFDQPVLAFIWNDLTSAGAGLVDSSDDEFGLDGTVYPAASLTNRGALENEATDMVTLGADGRTVTVTLRVTGGGVDQLRVITVPEPGTLLLLWAGAVAAFVRRRAARSANLL